MICFTPVSTLLSSKILKFRNCRADQGGVLRLRPSAQCRHFVKSGHEVPLRDWFKITHLMLTSEKVVSARQLGRYMGFGSVKTAWLMAHKIRTALIEPETKFGGIVEIDETFVGSKAKNRHWDKRDGKPGPTASGKAIVVGAVRRKGNVVARVIENVRQSTLEAFVNVGQG
jgi:hypothetical protein